MKFTYKWYLKDLEKVEKCGLKVFSCFACGGGSTMGYKMSGCEVLGCSEIDPEMMAIYKANHSPKYSYCEPIQSFKKRNDLPEELFNLDILDGSPPCSSFSHSGNRNKDWGRNKKFREGQAKQVLDDLFFDFIDVVNLLKPKVVIAENVKAIIEGHAKGYAVEISKRLTNMEYQLQVFTLNAATMGVPQRRNRAFFVARKRELQFDNIKLEFNEKPIAIKDALFGLNGDGKMLTKGLLEEWKKLKTGQKKKIRTACISAGHLPAQTINSRSSTGQGSTFHWEEPRKFSDEELKVIATFPLDFQHGKDCGYVTGMSVPPMMMHKIVEQIKKQWFKIEQ